MFFPSWFVCLATTPMNPFIHNMTWAFLKPPLVLSYAHAIFICPVLHDFNKISCINFLRTSPRESPGAGAWTLRQHHVPEPAAPQLQHVHLYWYGCRDGQIPSAPAFLRPTITQTLSLHCMACVNATFCPQPCSFIMFLCSYDELLTNFKLYGKILQIVY